MSGSGSAARTSVAELFFIDTNVLLYTLDPRVVGKQRRAQEWLERFWECDRGRISWQILHEYYWNATRKLGVPAQQARQQCEGLLRWHPIDTSASLVREAWRWIDSAGIAYWDALIVAAAEQCGARYLLTEDMQAGREFGGVRVVDPYGEEGARLLSTLS